jgi:hypothetical protein
LKQVGDEQLALLAPEVQPDVRRHVVPEVVLLERCVFGGETQDKTCGEVAVGAGVEEEAEVGVAREGVEKHLLALIT